MLRRASRAVAWAGARTPVRDRMTQGHNSAATGCTPAVVLVPGVALAVPPPAGMTDQARAATATLTRGHRWRYVRRCSVWIVPRPRQPIGSVLADARRAVLGVALAACLSWCEPAHAGFRAPVRIASLDAASLAAVGNARGVEAFAWTVVRGPFVRLNRDVGGQRAAVEARLRMPDGRLTAVAPVSGDGFVTNPAVGIDARGAVIVAWTRFSAVGNAIMVAVRSPRGRFGAPIAVGGGAVGPSELEMAMAPDGTAVLVWQDGRQLRAAVRPAGRCAARRPRACFGAPRGLSHGKYASPAIDARGNVYVTWVAGRRDRDGTVRTYLLLAVASRRTSFDAPQTIAPSGPTPASLAFMPDGSAVIAWNGPAPPGTTPEDGAPRAVLTTTRSLRGHLARSHTLSPDGNGSAPHAVATSQGEAIFGWRRYYASTRRSYGSELATVVRSRSGTFAPVQVVSPAGEDSLGEPALAVDRRGNAVLIADVDGAGGSYVAAAVRPPGGVFAPAIAFRGSRPYDLRAVFASGDGVTVAWNGSGGPRLRDWFP